MNKYEQCAKMFFRPVLLIFLPNCLIELPVLTFVRFCSFFDFKSCINNYISDIYLSKSFAVPAFLLSFSYNLFR